MSHKCVNEAMIDIGSTTDQADDLRFIRLAAQLVVGSVVRHPALEVRIFKIDHWFDYKWLRFSGKTLGALGVWKKPLTIPPFVANRIIDERYFIRRELSAGYETNEAIGDIHHRGWSAENLRREVRQIAPGTALFWYSGDTMATGRGGLMAYIPVDDDYWPWFLAFVRDGDWKIARRNGIHEYEVRLFREAGRDMQVELPQPAFDADAHR
jgi:hypothetical protein